MLVTGQRTVIPGDTEPSVKQVIVAKLASADSVEHDNNIQVIELTLQSKTRGSLLIPSNSPQWSILLAIVAVHGSVL
jgi:hypothetical protein